MTRFTGWLRIDIVKASYARTSLTRFLPFRSSQITWSAIDIDKGACCTSRMTWLTNWTRTIVEIFSLTRTQQFWDFSMIISDSASSTHGWVCTGATLIRTNDTNILTIKIKKSYITFTQFCHSIIYSMWSGRIAIFTNWWTITSLTRIMARLTYLGTIIKETIRTSTLCIIVSMSSRVTRGTTGQIITSVTSIVARLTILFWIDTCETIYASTCSRWSQQQVAVIWGVARSALCIWRTRAGLASVIASFTNSTIIEVFGHATAKTCDSI